jgi:tRNA(adenine34) deaminase
VNFKDSDVAAMQLALEQASNCALSGDVPVGAVVLDPAGEVIGASFNQRELLGDPTAHAEVMAIREAAMRLGHWRLDDCTLVVTLEPCVMCAGAILNARVSRVVYGADEPRTGAAGSLIDVLRDRRALHQVEVVRGVMADAAALQLSEFFTSLRSQSDDLL